MDSVERSAGSGSFTRLGSSLDETSNGNRQALNLYLETRSHPPILALNPAPRGVAEAYDLAARASR